jgi:hypothetical protein
MFNNVKRVAAVIALTGWMGVANASLIFDFSYGTTGNELVGEITGLVDGIDGQLQSAASIRFTTATGYYAAFQDIRFLSTNEIQSAQINEFRVNDLKLDLVGLYFDDQYVADFMGVGGREYVTFAMTLTKISISSIPFPLDLDSSTRSAQEFNGFVNRVDPTPAPEPSALFLLALGLAGVSFSRYKKKS